MTKKGIFIFRRDLRVYDNTGFIQALKKCDVVYPIFIFTPEQIGAKNKYRSVKSIKFMIESLEDLKRQLGGNITFFYGDNLEVVRKCIETVGADLVIFNADYTPYARKRDAAISSTGIADAYEDYTLLPIDQVVNKSGEHYKVFTPYYNACLKHKVAEPVNVRIPDGKLKKLDGGIPVRSVLGFLDDAESADIKGGRIEALQRLNQAPVEQNNYATTRNQLWRHTSRLSAYIKFGCVSIREVYHKMSANRDFTRELFWHDFYAQVLYSNPALGKSLKPAYDKLKWGNNRKWFNAWKAGKTGYPLVDAGMRELNSTGYMHNRTRMVVSSFLTKILLIDWRYGEKYFAQKLVDYDVASNNGGWQWSSGSGNDSQPYFRIFNPFRQSEEHDPECVYIKKWVPELREVPVKEIHNWDKADWKQWDYPAPICDYKPQKEAALKMYSDAL